MRLTESVELFSDNLRTLRQGGASPEDKNSIIEQVPAVLLPAYFQPLELVWNEYRDQARYLARESIQLPNGKPNPRFETAYQFILQNHAKLLSRNDNLVKAYLDYFDKQQVFRDNIFLVFFSVNIVSIFVMFFYVIGYVSRPISKLNDIEAIIREGNFERQIDYRRNDELGKVAKSINSLFRNLRNATDFILDIGEGKLNSEYQRPVGIDAQNDRLGTALMEMRDKMRQVNEQDRQRNWVSEGLAKFADIFQNRKDDEDFTYIIISNLVRYVGANQGGLFIVEDEKNEDSHLELIAAFAYEKRKYMQRRIDPGEGMIGEVYREGSLIYMTEVPEDYIHITSGLGDARPRSLLLVPLKLNEEIYGVAELASFEEFEPYKIDFVEKLGESIASTFASVKKQQKNRRTLARIDPALGANESPGGRNAPKSGRTGGHPGRGTT
ncbi:MAG: GAF domain-containing protein [Microscillaceae bacterium]|nr:GAF domain-containing protein [Microscillaceae bacterium]